MIAEAFEQIEQMQGRAPPTGSWLGPEEALNEGYARAAEDLSFLASCVIVRLARGERADREVQRLRCLTPPRNEMCAAKARGYQLALVDARPAVAAFVKEAAAASGSSVTT